MRENSWSSSFSYDGTVRLGGVLAGLGALLLLGACPSDASTSGCQDDPGCAMTGGSGGTNSTTSTTGPTSGSTTDADPTTSVTGDESTSTGDESTSTGSSTTAGTASTGSGSSTGSDVVCQDPDEPGTLSTAVPTNVMGCSPAITGFFHSADDVDWFTATVPGGCDSATWEVVPPANADTVCVVAACNANTLNCIDSTPMLFEDGFPACCSSAPHAPDFRIITPNQCDPPSAFYAFVEGSAVGTCVPYAFDIAFVDD